MKRQISIGRWMLRRDNRDLHRMDDIAIFIAIFIKRTASRSSSNGRYHDRRDDRDLHQADGIVTRRDSRISIERTKKGQLDWAIGTAQLIRSPSDGGSRLTKNHDRRAIVARSSRDRGTFSPKSGATTSQRQNAPTTPSIRAHDRIKWLKNRAKFLLKSHVFSL